MVKVKHDFLKNPFSKLESLLSIKTFLHQIHPDDDGVLTDYLSHWSQFSANRNEMLTREGDTERYMYFVLEGIQKSYYLAEGKEHVMAFTYHPSFSGIPESFLTQTPSNFFLETITKSRFLRISHEKHQEFMAKYHSIETLSRKATEEVLKGVIQRQYELMAYDMETRFRTFVQRSPHLLNQVPHKDLASYLRMDPTNFSKLLAKVKL